MKNYTKIFLLMMMNASCFAAIKISSGNQKLEGVNARITTNNTFTTGKTIVIVPNKTGKLEGIKSIEFDVTYEPVDEKYRDGFKNAVVITPAQTHDLEDMHDHEESRNDNKKAYVVPDVIIEKIVAQLTSEE